MKKATTTTAAANTATKIQKKSLFVEVGIQKSFCAVVLAMAITQSIYDPELDGPLVPPTKESKPRKPAYRKPEAVKQLEQVTGEKHRDDTANGLTNCIIAYVKYKGGQAERINTMGVPIDRRQQVTDILGRTRTIGSVQWRRSGSTIGSADISATIQGRSIKIEVKIGKDRQSDAQRKYQQQVEQAGGLYYIAKDFTSFHAWFQETFAKKGGEI